MADVIHDEAPVTAKQITFVTNSNPDLSQIKCCVMSGDWASRPEGVKPHLIQKDGLSIDADCLLWGSRVIIAPKLHGKIISELHNAHPGIVTMKAVDRAHVWWPGLDSDIESSARRCYTCQAQDTVTVSIGHVVVAIKTMVQTTHQQCWFISRKTFPYRS